ncbi:MAG: ATP synthase F0 subunit C [Oligoflexales bacterium]
MRKTIQRVLAVAGGLLMSSLAFAADGEGGSGAGLVAIGSGLAMGLAALGGTLGQAKAAGAALSGIARNPTASDKVFMPMIIALALIEFQAIMGFIIAFLWYGK